MGSAAPLRAAPSGQLSRSQAPRRQQCVLGILVAEGATPGHHLVPRQHPPFSPLISKECRPHAGQAVPPSPCVTSGTWGQRPGQATERVCHANPWPPWVACERPLC